MQELTNRMIRAALLQPQVYEEVEHDETATTQATVVVMLASAAGGVGTIQWQGSAFLAVSLGAVASLGGWLIWSLLAWVIGTRLLPETTTEADLGQLLRTLGFAAAPGILRVFGVIPGAVGQTIIVAATLWVLAAFVVAVRQALDYSSTQRALVVCSAGFLVQLLLLIQLAVLGMPVTTQI